MRNLIRHPVFRFLLIAFTLYSCWQMTYELWLHPIAEIDKPLIANINFISTHLLQMAGYNLLPEPYAHIDIRTVGVDGGHELWIGDKCSGLELFVLFSIFIIAFPGKIIRKIWYIPLGILIIHILNILRVVTLVLMTVYLPIEYMDFNHTYTFTITTYLCVFLLWYVWVSKLSGNQNATASS